MGNIRNNTMNSRITKIVALFVFMWKKRCTALLTTKHSSLRRRHGPRPLAATDTPDTKSDNKVHTVTWKTPNDDEENIIFPVANGEVLRTAALRRGLASPHNGRANLVNCRGLGTCGTCAVRLTTTTKEEEDDEHDWLPPPNAIESVRLAVPPGHGINNNAQRLRLACQVVVRGDVTVEKYNGFWGQYDQLVHPSVPTRPLGAVEFVLDRTSPVSSQEE